MPKHTINNNLLEMTGLLFTEVKNERFSRAVLKLTFHGKTPDINRKIVYDRLLEYFRTNDFIVTDQTNIYHRGQHPRPDIHSLRLRHRAYPSSRIDAVYAVLSENSLGLTKIEIAEKIGIQNIDSLATLLYLLVKAETILIVKEHDPPIYVLNNVEEKKEEGGLVE